MRVLLARYRDTPRHDGRHPAHGRRAGNDAVIVVREAQGFDQCTPPTTRTALYVGIVRFALIKRGDHPLRHTCRKVHRAEAEVDKRVMVCDELGRLGPVVMARVCGRTGKPVLHQRFGVADLAGVTAMREKHHATLPAGKRHRHFKTNRAINHTAYLAVCRRLSRRWNDHARFNGMIEV